MVVLLQLFFHHYAEPDQTGNKDQRLFILNKMGHPRPLFHLFSSFQTNIAILLQHIYVKNVMSIQYMVPGFEPMTFGTRISSHNH